MTIPEPQEFLEFIEEHWFIIFAILFMLVLFIFCCCARSSSAPGAWWSPKGIISIAAKLEHKAQALSSLWQATLADQAHALSWSWQTDCSDKPDETVMVVEMKPEEPIPSSTSSASVPWGQLCFQAKGGLVSAFRGDSFFLMFTNFLRTCLEMHREGIRYTEDQQLHDHIGLLANFDYAPGQQNITFAQHDKLFVHNRTMPPYHCDGALAGKVQEAIEYVTLEAQARSGKERKGYIIEKRNLSRVPALLSPGASPRLSATDATGACNQFLSL